MYKLSINKDLFEKILLKKINILEKENNNYWKKELLEPKIIADKLTYTIKQITKLLITNGLGSDKPQIIVECLKVDYSIEKNVFEFYLGKILEQKNTDVNENQKDKMIEQLLKEKEELENILIEIKNSDIFNN
jgi:Glu-tRNA(Gln) amidotransferase subunit E-like FAD-binding protein